MRLPLGFFRMDAGGFFIRGGHPHMSRYFILQIRSPRTKP
jgi:hypothetical protein